MSFQLVEKTVEKNSNVNENIIHSSKVYILVPLSQTLALNLITILRLGNSI